MSALAWNIKNGDLDQVKEEFETRKIDVNALIDGRCPLHYAADYGQTAVMQYLIGKGADVNKNDKHGISPLLSAVWEGHVKCVELLLENGADKTGKTPDGRTYLEAAEDDVIKSILSA